MRACVQRVSKASVTLRQTGEVSGQIGRGFLVLLGIGQGDTQHEAELLARKIAGLRIFDDGEGRMNLSLSDIAGEVLVVSQFTLYAQCKKGNRPSFVDAAPPELAKPLYRFFVRELRNRYGLTTATGQFQTEMDVALINDGPVTIWIDTEQLQTKTKEQSADHPA